MSTAQPNFVQLAKQGDARAIAALLNRSLQPKGITVKANLKDGCLHVILEATPVPEQQQLVAFLKKDLINLGCPAIKTVKLYGKKKGEDFPVWTESFALAEESSGESKVIQASSSNPSQQTKEANLKTPSSLVQPKRQKTYYLNPLRDGFNQVEDNLWFCIKQKALIGIGICSKEQFLDSSKQNSNGELATEFGDAIVEAGANYITGTGEPTDLLKVGISGAMLLGKIVADRFTSAEVFYNRGVDYLKSQNYQESIDSLNKAINKNNQYADALYLRGHIYTKLGDFQKAIKDLDKTISISLNYIDAYKERATVNYILGNYNKAIEDDNFLISKERGNSTAYFHRAMCFIALKDYETALKDFYFLTKAHFVNISPSLILYSYLIQGYISLCHLKNPSEAVEKFNHAIKLQKNSIEANLGCARTYEKLEDYDKAIQHYSKVIKDASGDSNKGLRASAYIGRCFSNLYYALSYAELGMHNSAIKHFSYADLDYRKLGVSKDRSKPIHIAILKGRCLSYLSLKKRFNARLDGLRAGIKSTEIKGLELVIWEKVCIIALVFSIPTGVCYGIFTNSVKLSVTPEVTKQPVKALTSNNSSLISTETIEFNGGKYLGDVRSGQANGKGTWVHPNGSHLEGQFKNNELVYGNGLIIGDGYKYEGSFKNGVRSGAGIVNMANGTSYEGNFEDNNPKGFGVTIFADKTRYEGEHKDGQFNGKGKLIMPSGIQWTGEFKDGKQDGKLVVKLPNGKAMNAVCIRGDCHF